MGYNWTVSNNFFLLNHWTKIMQYRICCFVFVLLPLTTKRSWNRSCLEWFDGVTPARSFLSNNITPASQTVHKGKECRKAITGWWYTYPSDKYEFVSWDDDIPNWMESHKIHVPNHPDYPEHVWKDGGWRYQSGEIQHSWTDFFTHLSRGNQWHKSLWKSWWNPTMAKNQILMISQPAKFGY